eukprot:UC1_evm1s1485
MIAEYCARAIGVDKSLRIKRAQALRSQLNAKYHQFDCFDVGALLGLGLHFDVIFIDISGSRDTSDLCVLLKRYNAALKP